MKKRNLIALLMAVCMMFSLLPVNALAVDDGESVPAAETLLSEPVGDSAQDEQMSLSRRPSPFPPAAT